MSEYWFTLSFSKILERIKCTGLAETQIRDLEALIGEDYDGVYYLASCILDREHLSRKFVNLLLNDLRKISKERGIPVYEVLPRDTLVRYVEACEFGFIQPKDRRKYFQIFVNKYGRNA